MRNYILLFLLAFAASLCTVDTVKAQAPLLYTGEMGPDTVNASETITHWPNGTSFATARRFKDLGALDINFQLDSLSGTVNVKSILYVSNDLAGTTWMAVDTITTTNLGSAHSKVLQFDSFNLDDDTDFKNTWFKITHTGTGTQAVKVQDTYAFKRRL